MIRKLNKENLKSAVKYLCKVDIDLASIYKTDGTPPLWARKPEFATLIKIILEQQVSLASAKAINDKLHKFIKPFTPEEFIDIKNSGLRKLGITRQKSSYIINLAEAVSNGEFNFVQLNKMNDDDAKHYLLKIKGVGSWSADIYLLMALQRPDIWPNGDIALAKAIKKVKRLKSIPENYKQNSIANKWKPYRAVAARMLWQHYIKNKL
ncbi:MAG: DNA-3-methyladenine glycosylase 2 family protein [Ignavibacteriaceae bacterium]|nr:DNA-3-methyladenine glycosylase 2 family protein [Ignavibacteria bacterium]NNL20767.1 DNA-3-methyladenine glycosylase 2 family protein [Ignavibacteriaceae bacterium]